MHRRVLSSKQRRELQRTLKQTQDIHQYRRILALLEVDAGRSRVAVAKSLCVSRSSVQSWLRQYEETPAPARLKDRPRSGRPRRITEPVQQILRGCLGRSAEPSGYQATEWTVPLLVEHLGRTVGSKLSEDTVRQALHALGYVWKRPRDTRSPDPEREKKTPHSGHVAHAGARRAGVVRG